VALTKSSFNGVKNRMVELNGDLLLQAFQQKQLIYRFKMPAGSQYYTVCS